MEKETGFFEVEAWGRLAEACGNQGRKGRGVRVVGRLKQDRWTGSDGKNHNKITIVAEHVEYRADFKKAEAPEPESMADSFGGDFETGREQFGFPKAGDGKFRDFPGNGVEEEELQAVAF